MLLRHLSTPSICGDLLTLWSFVEHPVRPVPGRRGAGRRHGGRGGAGGAVPGAAAARPRVAVRRGRQLARHRHARQLLVCF